ncbi:MAG: tRNA pseudouridine(13) synthase TruD, partial [Candidatus Woesearchaeota archaeon]|nr:tRNA pseudouridine(13) synthase TruD [Candidatus Woesearchaeota archaeon]
KDWFDECIELSYSRGILIFPKKAVDSGTVQEQNPMIPLIGFGSEMDDEKSPLTKKMNAIIKKILKEEGISERDFIINSIPELSMEGEERSAFCEIEMLKVSELLSDEVNSGKQKITLSFRLKKAAYATIAVKNFFS